MMKAVKVKSNWDPKPDFKLGPKDIDGKLSYQGSKVWRNSEIYIDKVEIPKPKENEVLIKVKASGICGTDVHLIQKDSEGYQLFSGLTAFPVIIGHEFSGVVMEAGKDAFNKRTNKIFEPGEPVCSEEMFWCGRCRPCCDGYPNNCERLQELGLSVNGSDAEYVTVDSKYCWSLKPLEQRYGKDKLFLAGSLVEPTSVAYMAVIERGGGIRAGDNVVILGGGPIGLAALAILKRSGATTVILSEPSEKRAKMAEELGADYIINPLKEDLTQMILKYTNGYGAKLYLEATGFPDIVFPKIEETIWWGKQLNSCIVIVAMVDTPIPINGTVYQIKRASIIGSQGHSGHGNFPRVIELMAAGMDMTKIITKTISIEKAPESVVDLQTNKDECKITIVF